MAGLMAGAVGGWLGVRLFPTGGGGCVSIVVNTELLLAACEKRRISGAFAVPFAVPPSMSYSLELVNACQCATLTFDSVTETGFTATICNLGDEPMTVKGIHLSACPINSALGLFTDLGPCPCCPIPDVPVADQVSFKFDSFAPGDVTLTTVAPGTAAIVGGQLQLASSGAGSARATGLVPAEVAANRSWCICADLDFTVTDPGDEPGAAQVGIGVSPGVPQPFILVSFEVVQTRIVFRNLADTEFDVAIPPVAPGAYKVKVCYDDVADQVNVYLNDVGFGSSPAGILAAFGGVASYNFLAPARFSTGPGVPPA